MLSTQFHRQGHKLNATSTPSVALSSLMIVDDDPLIRGRLAVTFSNDLTIHQAASRAAAMALLHKLPSPSQPVLIDLWLPPFPHHPEEGFHLTAELPAYSPKIKIFALSGQNDQSNFNLDQHLREQGGYYIAAAPEQSFGNVSEAARLPGINRTTLHSRIRCT